ncbi:hypothetical protein [Nocardia fusca]|uniref:hypothetical protein n=1 Tax=Nocardia fusca TaxID=941183 RepID=UPI000A6719B4|nr:hypothetical protein [Nocardia fusca]
MTSTKRPPVTVADWQTQLLRRIHHLAGEYARTYARGPQGYGGHDLDSDPETGWRAHLDVLEAAREHTEQVAVTAGVHPSDVDDARQRGLFGLAAPQQPPVREGIDRTGEMQDFYLDMLGLDLWHLERMASLHVTRTHRAAQGHSELHAGPMALRTFADNMALRSQRVTALAHVLRVTDTEAAALWGPGATSMRYWHAAAHQHASDLDLAAEWHSYSRPSAELATPPYVPDLEGAALGFIPPTPELMLDAATATLHTEILHTATEPIAAPGPGLVHAAISEAVDAAIPGTGTWIVDQPETSPEAVAPHPGDIGTDP